jgi:putative phosphonate catabolism associated alcohol dehydrogenase
MVCESSFMQSVPGKVRAAVFRGAGKTIALEEIPIPALGAGDVLARIRCATICGSDVHSFLGRRQVPIPTVLGHETVAEIAAIGPNGAFDYRGNPLGVGDRITWSIVWSCGDCFYCHIGLSAKCVRLLKFGHEPVDGKRALFGGLSEYCLLPEKTAIFRVPENLTDNVACPANCATATVAGALRRAGTMAGQTVLIHGAGALGLTACAMASVSDADPIIVIEPEARRREQAMRFGAQVVLDPAEPVEVIQAKVKELSEGRGADLGLEFSGSPDSTELGLQLLRPGGRFILVGAAYPSRAIAVMGEEIVKRMLTVTGTYNYQPKDLEFALNFLAHCHAKWPFHELVERSFPLQEAHAAFSYAASAKPLRVAVRP